MSRPRGLPLGTWLAVTLLIASSSLVGGASPMTAEAQEVDPQKVSLRETDLRPGFKRDQDKTGSREPIPGIKVYEADFVRDRSRDNLSSGPIEVKSLVARTTSEQQAKDQYASSRQALLGADPKWNEAGVAQLGDDATGLTAYGSMEGGSGVAHLFLFRRGSMVVGITVAGLEKVTRMAEAEALAAVVLRRIDPEYAMKKAPAVSRSLNTQPPGSSSSSSSSSPSSSSSTSRTSSPPASSPSGSSSTSTQQSPGQRIRVANTDGVGLRLRTGPGTTYSVASVLPEGTILEVIGNDQQAGGRTWKNVRAPGDVKGWVAGEYTVVVTVAAPDDATTVAAPDDATTAAASIGGTTS